VGKQQLNSWQTGLSGGELRVAPPLALPAEKSSEMIWDDTAKKTVSFLEREHFVGEAARATMHAKLWWLHAVSC
jgi:hypothetical protein